MKALYPEQVTHYFASLSERFEVHVPVLLADGTRTFGSLDDGPAALHGGSVLAKPTSAFFPQHGLVFSAGEGGVCVNPERSRPLLIFGFTHRDIACLRFIDRFFADGWSDDVYFRLRRNVVVACLSGYCGPGGALLPLAGGCCDLELAWDGDRWLVETYSEIGREIASGIADDVPAASLQILREKSLAHPDEGDDLIRRASELLRSDRVPDSFWSEIGDRCIACTGCNLVCPTCTCFGVQDWRYSQTVERSRMWDSCQLDGFMREASGHNPLGTEALRTRRRIHHKLAADPERWGEISCFVCGRCDQACPTGIGMQAVAKQIVERYGGE